MINQIISDVLRSRADTNQKHKRLPAPDKVMSLCDMASNVLKNDPVLLKIEGDFIIVGDLHGNIDDLLRIFDRFDYPPVYRYLFLGDYVDRGTASVEILLMLFSLKIKFPDHIYLLRGNHETDLMAKQYGFRQECCRRLNKKCYQKFLECFKQLSIACVVNNKIFCVHGGIAPDLKNIATLSNMNKVHHIPQYGIIADMLWSDPAQFADEFEYNDRGVGYVFGSKPLLEFLNNHSFDFLVRSHEECEKGFLYPYNDEAKSRCITIFSACNYCGDNNDGAVLVIKQAEPPRLVVFNPFTKAEMKKRRIIFPEWLLNSSKPKKPITLNDDSNNSEQSEPSFIESQTGATLFV